MTKYHYTECGLDNVYIEGLAPVIDEEGDEVIEIRFIAALHAEIARGIINQKGKIDGPELRFLRTEMGLTQSELAQVASVTHQLIGRAERGETPLNPTAETVIRRVAAERLIEAFTQSIEDLAASIRADSTDEEINVEMSGNGYRLIAA